MKDGTELGLTNYVRAIAWMMVTFGILGGILLIIQRPTDTASLSTSAIAVLAGYFLLRQTAKKGI